MDINKGKCEAWCAMARAIMRMTKDLTDDEKKYILYNSAIAISTLKLKELEEK